MVARNTAICAREVGDPGQSGGFALQPPVICRRTSSSIQRANGSPAGTSWNTPTAGGGT